MKKHSSKNSRNNREFENFDRTMEILLKASHADLKAALDAEKLAKAKKRKAKESSASGRASPAKA